MKNWKHFHLASTLVILFCMGFAMFAPNRLVAQVDRGKITGTVQDASGAVIPNAKITLTNDATNVAMTTTSTGTGTYMFSNIIPGTYTLVAEYAGFSKFAAPKIDVHVQQTLTLDVSLTAGSVEQTVTVTTAAALLEAESATVGQTIDNQVVDNLPLSTRNWGSLAQLSAGVSTAAPGQPSADSGSTASAYFSVHGASVWQNDFRLNGINDNIEMYGGNYTGTNAAIVPPPDAVQEFKVQSGDFSAEFGHSTGGVVNAAIKSGTNRIHGDLWEYVRNDAFNAIYYFNSPTAKKPEYRQNLFGGTVGGPVQIPHIYHGRNRTFFFFDYQGGRYISPSPATSTVPTTSMASSGFTNLQDLITYNSGTGTDALGRIFPHGTILDPATTRAIAAGATDPISGRVNSTSSTVYVRDPFYGCTVSGCPTANYATGGPLTGITNFNTASAVAMLNILPTSRLDPNAVKLLGVYPAQNAPGLNSNYVYVPKAVHNTNTWDVRIDENINASNVIFGVFDKSYYTTAVPGAMPGQAVGQSGARFDSLPAYAFAFGYTHTFTPTFTNEMHVGMVHSDKMQKSTYGNIFGIPAQYGIQGIQQVANNGGLPPLTINGLTHIGVGNYTPTLQHVYSIEGADAVTKLYRSHTFKIGLQVDDLEGDISQPPQGRGNYNFNGQYSDIPNKNSSLTGVADMLLAPINASVSGGINQVGGMSSFSGSNISATNDNRWYWGIFFQDDWKATPKLTLNLGVRWDYFTPYAETSGRQANFIADGGNGTHGTYYIPKKGCSQARSASFDALLTASNIELKCVSNMSLGNAQKENFSPRVGFAYRLRPTLVVRGGFGIAYGALGNLGYSGTLGTNYPFVYTATFNSPDSQHSLQLSDGTPATMEHALATVNFQDPTINNGQGLNLYGRQYNFQTPYIQTQNLTAEYQFTAHDAIQVGFVGSQGRHLDNLGYHNSNTQFLPVGANAQNYIPYPKFARNSTYETTNGTSLYSSFQTTYEHQMQYGLTVLFNYTYSKCMSSQHTQASQNIQYRAQWLAGYGVKGDYALCDTDATHITHLAGTYNLPFGRGRTLMADSNRFVNAALGDWGLGYIFSFQTGQPFTVGCPTSTSASFGCTANVVKGQDMYAGPHNKTRWLNPSAFVQPPAATTIGQTDYSPLGGRSEQARGPRYGDLDLSLSKKFPVTESMRFEFRAEAFNATNTPQFAQPGQLNFTNLSKFSSITGTKNSNQNQGARTLQFALKLFY